MDKGESVLGNEEVVTRYSDYVMPVWKSLNVPIERSSGCYVEDFEGNSYVDAFSGISVTNVGHGNEAVIRSISEQLNRHIHGCSYLHPTKPVADLAERLAEITPGSLEKSFFCNSGTESVEGAVKLARKYTGKKEIIALEMGFHGRTLGSLALTGNKSYKLGMAPTINDVSHATAPYAFRCQTCDGGPCPGNCAEDVATVIETHTSGDLAAVVVEPIMGEAGVIVPPKGWLSRVQDIAHGHDALFIVDEVQTGYGRTGEWWGVDHFSVEPDILCQAKGIANGLPLGAFTARSEIADAFDAGDHYSTFGGNPVACAAAMATIDELSNGIMANARERGVWLEKQLGRLEREYEVIGESRGIGLMHGVEIVDVEEASPTGISPAPDSEMAKEISKMVRDEGVIVGVGGFHNNTLRIQPPLTISHEEIRMVVEGLESALDGVSP